MPITIPIEIGDVIRVGKFKNKRITVKEIGSDEYGLPTCNGKGIMKIRIEKLMPPKEPKKENEIQENNMKRTLKEMLHDSDTQVTIKQIDGTWWIQQTETKENLNRDGFESKEAAEHAALTKGYSFPGVEKFAGKEIEIPKLTKTEPIKHDKPEEMKLSKEKELKMEILRIAKRVIAEEISDIKSNSNIINQIAQNLWPNNSFKGNQIKREVDDFIKTNFPNKSYEYVFKELNRDDPGHGFNENFSKKKDLTEADVTDKPELEAKARRYAELAQSMKKLEAELKEMETEFTKIDQEFRPLLESIGKTKDTFIRAGKLLIKIEREGYEKGSASYKTGFDYLYSKVNGTMKTLADEALSMTKTVSYVKSKIAVVDESVINEMPSWLMKIKNFLSNKLKKIFGLNKQANDSLSELEKSIQ